MVDALFKLKSQIIFFLFGHHFDCPGSGSVFPIRIRIQGSHCNTDPHGSRSGSEILVLGQAAFNKSVTAFRSGSADSGSVFLVKILIRDLDQGRSGIKAMQLNMRIFLEFIWLNWHTASKRLAFCAGIIFEILVQADLCPCFLLVNCNPKVPVLWSF